MIASGADRTAGRELTLKIEEGAWIPAAYRDLETFLHGHLAATDESQGLVLILSDRDGTRRTARSGRPGRFGRLGRSGWRRRPSSPPTPPSTCRRSSRPPGRIVIPEASSLPSPVAALLGTATPLQLLTERIARARGVDPDAIHRDVDRYREAADAAEG